MAVQQWSNPRIPNGDHIRFPRTSLRPGEQFLVRHDNFQRLQWLHLLHLIMAIGARSRVDAQRSAFTMFTNVRMMTYHHVHEIPRIFLGRWFLCSSLSSTCFPLLRLIRGIGASWSWGSSILAWVLYIFKYMVYKAVICERILLSFQVKIFLRDVVEYGDMVFWAQKKRILRFHCYHQGICLIMMNWKAEWKKHCINFMCN